MSIHTELQSLPTGTTITIQTDLTKMKWLDGERWTQTGVTPCDAWYPEDIESLLEHSRIIATRRPQRRIRSFLFHDHGRLRTTCACGWVSNLTTDTTNANDEFSNHECNRDTR